MAEQHQLSHSYSMASPASQFSGEEVGSVLAELNELIGVMTQALAEAQKPAIDEHTLWSAEQIAEHLNKGVRLVKESYIHHSTFPRVIVLPTTGDGRSRSKRWYAQEVLEWVSGLRDAPVRGRPRQR